jgi:hypothetical protein
VRQTRPARNLPPRVAHLRLDLPLGPHVSNNNDDDNNYKNDNSSKTSTQQQQWQLEMVKRVSSNVVSMVFSHQYYSTTFTNRNEKLVLLLLQKILTWPNKRHSKLYRNVGQ